MEQPRTPHILIIYTGGTIGMIENPETGALENFDFEQFRHYVPELNQFTYRFFRYGAALLGENRPYHSRPL